MEILLCVIVSIIVSVVTVRLLTVKYFNVIDKYVKALISDINNIIRETTRNK